MSTCEQRIFVEFLSDSPIRTNVCGLTLQGRGPCATCGHPDWRDAHRFKLDVIARHAYVPSEYTCEAGHLSAAVSS